MRTPKLKKCPFCGRIKNVEVAHTACYWVVCMDCSCDGPTANYQTEKQAITAWNRRAGKEP